MLTILGTIAALTLAAIGSLLFFAAGCLNDASGEKSVVPFILGAAVIVVALVVAGMVGSI